MKFVLALGSLFTFLVCPKIMASEIQDLRAMTYADGPECQGTLAATEKYLAVGSKNELITPQISLTKLDDWSNLGKLAISGPIKDLKIQGDDLYVLTGFDLEIWSLVTLQNSSKIKLPADINLKSPTGFVIQGDRAFVSLGNQGLLELDLKSGTEIHRLSVAPHTAVTDLDFLDEQHLILSVDDTAEGAFQGMVVVNIEPFKVQKEVPLRGAAAPLSVRVSGENVYFGLFPAIWKFNRAELLSERKVKTITRAWNFLGASGSSMIGKNFYDSNYLYTCVEANSQYTPKVIKLSELKFK